MGLLADKTAVVTGASRGIGEAIARRFAAEGANVILAATNSELLLSLHEELKGAGSETSWKSCDVSDIDSFNELIQHSKDGYGGVDILVNNAGITRDKLLMAMKEQDWDDVMNVNLKGTFNGIKSVSRTMLKAKSGSIINITSIVGIRGNAGQANYAASKAGIIGLTKSAAREFSSRGIRVNAIAPGFIQSDMTDTLPEEVKETFVSNIPLGRSGDGEDVANCALFLACDLSSYITGQVINVDGGLLM